MKWDGEWHISTYEVFRDLGMAFAAVLILIYVLIVAWFKNFITPLIIMAPIPLTWWGFFRPLALRRFLHRDLDDRLHRAGGDHRRSPSCSSILWRWSGVRKVIWRTH